MTPIDLSYGSSKLRPGKLLLAFSSALILSACGGGDDSGASDNVSSSETSAGQDTVVGGVRWPKPPNQGRRPVTPSKVSSAIRSRNRSSPSTLRMWKPMSGA